MKNNPLKIMRENGLSGSVFEKDETIIYIHSMESLGDCYRLNLTDLNTNQRRNEIPTNVFFKDYFFVSDNSLIEKGLYQKVSDLRVGDKLAELSPSCTTLAVGNVEFPVDFIEK